MITTCSCQIGPHTVGPNLTKPIYCDRYSHLWYWYLYSSSCTCHQESIYCIIRDGGARGEASPKWRQHYMRGVPEINLKHMNEAHEKLNFLEKKLYKGPILDAIAYPGSSPLGLWVSEWFIVSDIPLAGGPCDPGSPGDSDGPGGPCGPDGYDGHDGPWGSLRSQKLNSRQFLACGLCTPLTALVALVSLIALVALIFWAIKFGSQVTWLPLTKVGARTQKNWRGN